MSVDVAAGVHAWKTKLEALVSSDVSLCLTPASLIEISGIILGGWRIVRRWMSQSQENHGLSNYDLACVSPLLLVWPHCWLSFLMLSTLIGDDGKRNALYSSTSTIFPSSFFIVVFVGPQCVGLWFLPPNAIRSCWFVGVSFPEDSDFWLRMCAVAQLSTMAVMVPNLKSLWFSKSSNIFVVAKIVVNAISFISLFMRFLRLHFNFDALILRPFRLMKVFNPVDDASRKFSMACVFWSYGNKWLWFSDVQDRCMSKRTVECKGM